MNNRTKQEEEKGASILGGENRNCQQIEQKQKEKKMNDERGIKRR